MSHLHGLSVADRHKESIMKRIKEISVDSTTCERNILSACVRVADCAAEVCSKLDSLPLTDDRLHYGETANTIPLL